MKYLATMIVTCVSLFSFYYNNEISLQNNIANQINICQLNDEKNNSLSSWSKYHIQNVGTISIPPSLELRNSQTLSANQIKNYKTTYEKVFNLGEMKSQIIFQPVGINKGVKDSFKKYCRILIDLDKGEIGDFMTQNELNNLSTSDLKKLDALYKEFVIKMFNGTDNRINEWIPIQKVNINDKSYLRIEYTRQINGNIPVLVILLVHPRNNEQIRLTLSYRDSEKIYWQADFDKIIENLLIIE